MANTKRLYPNSPKNHLPNQLFMGAIAGLVATIPMSWALGTIDTSADDELVANIVHRTGYPLDADERHLATFVSRFGFGASAGFLFAVLQGHLGADPSSRLAPRYRAPLFAVGLWALTSIGKRMATQKRPSHAKDELILFGSHLLWGLSVARLIDASPREVIFGIVSGIFSQSPIAREVRALVSESTPEITEPFPHF